MYTVYIKKILNKNFLNTVYIKKQAKLFLL